MSKPLQTADPLAGYQAHAEEIRAVVERVLAGGRYILGPEVEAFEREFAAYHGGGHTVGVANGTEALELELMVDYGMTPVATLKSATSVNAKILHMESRLGAVKQGLWADLIAVDGDPTNDITRTRAANVKFVMKNGTVYKRP